MHVVRVENLVRGMGESLVQPSPLRDNKLILFPKKKLTIEYEDTSNNS